jgi:hypothetical protein
MKAHNITPKGALVGGNVPAGGSAGSASSPTAPKKRSAKKRKVQAESESEDETPDVKKEVKKEVKPEKKPKDEAKHPDDGSFMLSDIPEAPPSFVEKAASRDDGVGAGGFGDLDVCHACTTEQAVKQEPALKHESGFGYDHTSSPHPEPSLDNGGAFSRPMAPTAALQSFGYGTNSGFQSLAPAQMPIPIPMIEPSNGSSGVFPGGSWLQTGPQHYYWAENTRL